MVFFPFPFSLSPLPSPLLPHFHCIRNSGCVNYVQLLFWSNTLGTIWLRRAVEGDENGVPGSSLPRD
jgi:hypothetical protein